LDSTTGTVNFNIADTEFYQDTVSAFTDMLGDAGWSGNKKLLINATLDTANKKLKVNSATAKVLFPGASSPTEYSISIGDLDLSTALSTYYASAKKDGQDSVNVVMGSWSNGVVTFSPSVGSGNGKTLTLSNISGSNSITSNGPYTYTVMYEDEYGNDTPTGLTQTVNVAVPTNTVGAKPTKITANGTYTASTDNLDGYTSVEVEVAGANHNPYLTDSEGGSISGYYPISAGQTKRVWAVCGGKTSSAINISVEGGGGGGSHSISVSGGNQSSTRPTDGDFEYTVSAGYYLSLVVSCGTSSKKITIRGDR
jgi:hypothetical protein